MTTPKQKRFIDGIVSGKNPSEAYKAAGYRASNPDTVAKEAQRLLQNPHIAPIIEDAQNKATKAAIWSREMALERLQRLNDASYQAAVNMGDLSAKGAPYSFFNSLDRLNALTGITISQDAEQQIIVPDITPYLAPVYLPLHADIQRAKYQYFNLPGGRGSGKSSFVALEIIYGIMKDKTGESNSIVFRRYAATMRESVYSQIAWAVDTLGVSDLWRGNVSPMTWTYLPTGAQIIFRGLDDSSKLKSIKPRHGIFRFAWFEEFSELPGENFVRSVMQSVARGGNSFIVFRSFNPPISLNNWANVFIARPDDRAVTLHTSYKDMPPEWLGDDFIAEAERLKEINETAYRHEYMGEATGSGGEVFQNIEARELTDTEISQFQYIYCGVDFGFSVDPAVFIRVAYDDKNDTVYFLDEIYRKHCSNKELADAIKEKGYDRAFVGQMIDGDYVEFQRQEIIADAAEPKSIADLQNEGLLVNKCDKFPGSVLYGIKWLQSRKLVIDPKRTPHTYREFSSYEYLTTPDGEFLADVPDKDNHCIDGTRYALNRLIKRRGVSA